MRRPPTMDAAQNPRSESLVRFGAFRACVQSNTTLALCESFGRLQRHLGFRVPFASERHPRPPPRTAPRTAGGRSGCFRIIGAHIFPRV